MSYEEAKRRYAAIGVDAGAAMLIAPEKPLDISRICHDPDRMQRVYDVGHTLGMKLLREVKEFAAGR